MRKRRPTARITLEACLEAVHRGRVECIEVIKAMDAARGIRLRAYRRRRQVTSAP